MLDKNSKKIVRALESDARMSFAALGDEIGMSKTPCWNKVQQLQNTGVIQGYSAQLDPKALGLTIRALVLSLIHI